MGIESKGTPNETNDSKIDKNTFEYAKQILEKRGYNETTEGGEKIYTITNKVSLRYNEDNKKWEFQKCYILELNNNEKFNSDQIEKKLDEIEKIIIINYYQNQLDKKKIQGFVNITKGNSNILEIFKNGEHNVIYTITSGKIFDSRNNTTMNTYDYINKYINIKDDKKIKVEPENKDINEENNEKILKIKKILEKRKSKKLNNNTYEIYTGITLSIPNNVNNTGKLTLNYESSNSSIDIEEVSDKLYEIDRIVLIKYFSDRGYECEMLDKKNILIDHDDFGEELLSLNDRGEFSINNSNNLLKSSEITINQNIRDYIDKK